MDAASTQATDTLVVDTIKQLAAIPVRSGSGSLSLVPGAWDPGGVLTAEALPSGTPSHTVSPSLSATATATATLTPSISGEPPPIDYGFGVGTLTNRTPAFYLIIGLSVLSLILLLSTIFACVTLCCQRSLKALKRASARVGPLNRPGRTQLMRGEVTEAVEKLPRRKIAPQVDANDEEVERYDDGGLRKSASV